MFTLLFVHALEANQPPMQAQTEQCLLKNVALIMINQRQYPSAEQKQCSCVPLCVCIDTVCDSVPLLFTHHYLGAQTHACMLMHAHTD